MAPEQMERRGEKSTRTDIFAIGCLLYEVVSLRRPSKRDDQPLESLAISAMVSRACAANPEDRYRSVALLGSDIRRYLSGHSPEVQETGFWREVRLFYRRNRTVCLVALAFSLLLIGAATVFTQRLRASNTKIAEALQETRGALAIADEERMSAEQARRQAESNMDRYRLERDYASALLKARGESIIDRTVFLIHNLMIRETISPAVLENSLLEINQELEKQPPANDRIWSLKAHLLFMTQRFAEAEEFYAINTHDQSYLRELIPEFSPLIQENGILSAKDLKRLLRQLALAPHDRQPLSEKMVIYDRMKRNSPVETAKLVETLLRISNPRWSHGEFDYDPEAKHLKITGHYLRSFLRRGGALDLD